MVGQGFNDFLGIGEETTWGTAVARTAYLEVNDESLVDNEEFIESASLRSAGMRTNRSVQGPIDPSGTIVFEAQFEGWELFLKHAMGTVTTTQLDSTTGTDAYRHVFTMSQPLPTGLTLHVNKDPQAFNFVGGMISSLNFSVSVGGFLLVTADVFCKEAIKATSADTPTFSSSDLVTVALGS